MSGWAEYEVLWRWAYQGLKNPYVGQGFDGFDYYSDGTEDEGEDGYEGYGYHYCYDWNCGKVATTCVGDEWKG